MSDLIERQAAIDALEAIGQNYNLAKAYVVGVIEELPSAQSEITECPMCPDCPDNCPLEVEHE